VFESDVCAATEPTAELNNNVIRTIDSPKSAFLCINLSHLALLSVCIKRDEKLFTQLFLNTCDFLINYLLGYIIIFCSQLLQLFTIDLNDELPFVQLCFYYFLFSSYHRREDIKKTIEIIPHGKSVWPYAWSRKNRGSFPLSSKSAVGSVGLICTSRPLFPQMDFSVCLMNSCIAP